MLDERFENFEIIGMQRYLHLSKKYSVEFFNQFDLLT